MRRDAFLGHAVDQRVKAPTEIMAAGRRDTGTTKHLGGDRKLRGNRQRHQYQHQGGATPAKFAKPLQVQQDEQAEKRQEDRFDDAGQGKHEHGD